MRLIKTAVKGDFNVVEMTTPGFLDFGAQQKHVTKRTLKVINFKDAH